MKNLTISVSYGKGTDEVQLGVHAGKTAVFFGNWSTEILLNGKPLLPDGDWEEVCAHNENDCDYLEIDVPLTENYHLQRFFLLDHKDKLLLFGDTVLPHYCLNDDDIPTDNRLKYKTVLPLSRELQLRKKSKSGAAIYKSKDKLTDKSKADVCRLFPFFICAEQSDDCGYEGFNTSQTGRSLFAAFCVDLNPKRFDTDCSWQRLTVGEDRQTVQADKAAAYHFQLGKQETFLQHFLLYRSLTAPANRTFFGHNLIDDFCFARFDAKKGVEALIEVQNDE